MAKKEKNQKTNAIRILDQKKVEYEIYTYDTKDGKIDGISVSQKIGIDPASVFKTLVAYGGDNRLYVFCIPVDKELDLKRAAAATGEKKIVMLPVKDIFKYTGYIRGGCSPIAMKKRYPTVIDESALCHHKIVVSGGAIGIQILIEVSVLLQIVDGTIDKIVTL